MISLHASDITELRTAARYSRSSPSA